MHQRLTTRSDYKVTLTEVGDQNDDLNAYENAKALQRIWRHMIRRASNGRVNGHNG